MNEFMEDKVNEFWRGFARNLGVITAGVLFYGTAALVKKQLSK